MKKIKKTSLKETCNEEYQNINLYSFTRTIIFFVLLLPAVSYADNAPHDEKSNNNDDIDSSGIYVGGRLGYSHNGGSCFHNTRSCDKDNVGYGAYIGYQLNKKIALDLSYNDIGDTKAEYPSIDLDGELTDINLALKGSYPVFDKTSLFLKAGLSHWKGKVKGDGIHLSDSGYRPLLGAGVEMPFSDRILARLEYQYIDKVGNKEMGYTDPHFLSIAIQWNFFSRKKSPPPASPVVVTQNEETVIKKEPKEIHKITIDEHHGGPLFDVDKVEIKNTAAIDPIVDMLIGNESLHVTIIGHTDSDGSAHYNQRLSESRANAVAKYMRSRGISLERIKTFGMGEDQPVSDNLSNDGKSRNRRVEFYINGDKALP